MTEGEEEEWRRMRPACKAAPSWAAEEEENRRRWRSAEVPASSNFGMDDAFAEQREVRDCEECTGCARSEAQPLFFVFLSLNHLV